MNASSSIIINPGLFWGGWIEIYKIVFAGNYVVGKEREGGGEGGRILAFWGGIKTVERSL